MATTKICTTAFVEAQLWACTICGVCQILREPTSEIEHILEIQCDECDTIHRVVH
ncbi:MAG: hypothetical protein GY928_04430 [Colwellia sp.]|nr:hypothetical protein [Colwellia sp.]